MSAAFKFLVSFSFAAAATLAEAQQLPIDINQLDQLTPDQRSQALQILGQSTAAGLLPNQGQTSTSGNQNSSAQQRLSTLSGQLGTGYDQNELRRRYSSLPSVVDCDDPDATQVISTDGFDSTDNGNPTRGAGANHYDCARARRGSDLYERSDKYLRPVKPFGYDLFSAAPTTFAPATDIPVPSDYVLGPGDTLRVLLYGNTNSNVALTVSRDGTINFPKLGPITVAGLRFDDARTMIQDRISKEMIGVQCNVTLGELRSIQVYLLGDVNQPGSYTVSSLSTITNALLVGGGVSLVGSLRNIQLKRQGRIVRTLDLYDLLLRGDSNNDDRLQPGDVIFVPPVGPRVTINGEVKRPAIYELKGDTKLSDIIATAGGLMASTSTSTAEVTRFDSNRKSVLLQVDVSKPTDLALHMQDGDLVRVRKLAGPIENHVRVSGFVRYPGNYEWSPKADLAQLLNSAQVLPSETGKETYLPLGLIERTNADSGVRSWTSFNTRDVELGRATEPLQRDDLVIILSRDDVAYLGSKAVRDVASGDLTGLQTCPALKELAAVVNSERSVRFIKALRSETNRFETSEQQFSAENKTSVTSTAITPHSAASIPAGTDSSALLAAGAMGAAAAAGGAGTSGSTEQDRLQAAIRNRLTEQSNAERRASAENVQCPAIFKEAPGALPYLLDQAIAVYGEVSHPGLYPVSTRISLGEVVEIAGGRTRESDSTNIEYVSYADALKSGHPVYQQLDVDKVAQIPIGAGDILTFKPVYSGQEVGTVVAAGEFRFPATYGILRGEHLSQLMARAGGLTENAYPDGAVFTRLSAAKSEQESYHRAARDLQEAMVTAVSSGSLGNNAPVSAQFVNSILVQLENAPAIGRVVINARPEALRSKPDLDPILEPGDAIVMPKRPISVTVIGQVLNPGTQQYLPGLSAERYIQKAGGYTQAADNSRTFIILPNGTSMTMQKSFWYSSSSDIPPGSVVVVPRDATPFSWIGWSDRIFSVVSQMAVTAAALNTITK